MNFLVQKSVASQVADVGWSIDGGTTAIETVGVAVCWGDGKCSSGESVVEMKLHEKE
jgi:hypothetical protein